MPKYRKIPVTIEAVQFDGTNAEEISNFVGADLKKRFEKLYIHTLEGEMSIAIGDYIIKGVAGEFYPCKENIFLKTYESVDK